MTNQLNDMMSGDGTVVLVHADRTFARYDTRELNEYAPSVMMTTDDTGQILAEDLEQFVTTVENTGWTLEKGWSGQYLTKGTDPMMHESEYIGGALMEHILDTPGLWCVMPVDVESEECPNDSDDCKLSDMCDDCINGDGYQRECVPAGWVVMHREPSA